MCQKQTQSLKSIIELIPTVFIALSLLGFLITDTPKDEKAYRKQDVACTVLNLFLLAFLIVHGIIVYKKKQPSFFRHSNISYRWINVWKSGLSTLILVIEYAALGIRTFKNQSAVQDAVNKGRGIDWGTLIGAILLAVCFAFVWIFVSFLTSLVLLEDARELQMCKKKEEAKRVDIGSREPLMTIMVDDQQGNDVAHSARFGSLATGEWRLGGHFSAADETSTRGSITMGKSSHREEVNVLDALGW